MNDETQDYNCCLMIWKNNDFYIGKAKPNFCKEGHGVLFIYNKFANNKSMIGASDYHENIMRVNLLNDPKLYEKVIISEWLEDNPKPQSL